MGQSDFAARFTQWLIEPPAQILPKLQGERGLFSSRDDSRHLRRTATFSARVTGSGNTRWITRGRECRRESRPGPVLAPD